MTDWNADDEALLRNAFATEPLAQLEVTEESLSDYFERILKERYAFAEASAQWCKEAGENYHEAKRHEAEAKRNRRAFKLATLVATILGSWLIVIGIWAVLR